MTESINILILVIQVTGMIVWDLLRTPGILPALMGGWFALALAPAVISTLFPPSK